MLFNQRINLVEPTKLLQRVTVDTLTFKRPLYHDYISLGVPISKDDYIITKASLPPEYSYTFFKFNFGEKYKSIESSHSIPVYAYCWADRKAPLNPTMKNKETTIQVKINGNIIGTYITEQNDGALLDTIKYNGSGELEIIYTAKLNYYKIGQSGLYEPYVGDQSTDTVATINLSAVQNISPKPNITLADVVDRVLNAGLGDNNHKYHLDDKSRIKLEQYTAPEFYFTRNTLFEVLLQIGGYSDVQGIPRLTTDEKGRLNTITYDFLSEEEWLPRKRNGEEIMPIGRRIEYASDDWCGGFETYAENLVDQSENGAVRQPCMKTVRTETGNLIIDDNSVIIKSESLIYTVKSLEMGYIMNGVFVGEIEPYVFEESEYNNLSGYDGEYPFAKKYAFYYKQGTKDIRGLTLKKETFIELGLAFEQMAAAAIAEQVTGVKPTKAYGLAQLAYRLTYIPIVTARLKQFRPYSDSPQREDNVLFYNQSANSFDTNHYGSNVKNTLVQTGNKLELLTFQLRSFSVKPVIGQRYKGKYITAVDYEYDRNWIRATMTLVENYNRKSQYLALDSRQRFYEISEKDSVDRLCNFSFKVEVGDADKFTADEKNRLLLRSYFARDDIAAYFRTGSGIAGMENKYRLNGAIAQPKNKDGGVIGTPTIHEANVGAFGNSVFISWQYADNYSAGDQAVFNAAARKLQRAVQYGDEYGEFHSLLMSFITGDRITTNYLSQLPKELGGTGFCDALPSIPSSQADGISKEAEYEREIQKNCGEHIAVTTQLHFKVNTREVVIGSALARCNFLVAINNPELRCVALPYALPLWQEKIPVGDLDKYGCQSAAVERGDYVSIYPIGNGSAIGGKSWALTTKDGEILVARNGDFASDAEAKEISIKFWY